ncbi:glycoside hydrolase family 13 protein [Actinomadura chibensis]|uniref:Glycoside hydrolase family 13 protein n=1 Tax=Actinomadura chibensis TaxID=392828 RepID=A0A5D0NXQ4_9ACTN|nr:glycoside hydrolase family 13 protein [Actinomadura chibensis]TYB48954.1 glycoside hydrolase family 13 protein [Actinomadura chibensis]
MAAGAAGPAGHWWRNASVYQVYIRSFADGNGDGIGDLRGLRERLPYLRDLNVDALWITPWYVSPMVDGGYDIADYRDIDPLFGTLKEAEDVIEAAHATGLKVIVDLVPNHCSTLHPWFRAAVAAPPGSPERERFWFRPGRGPEGELPPNDWRSTFGGSAWTRLRRPDGGADEWYLHLFDPSQPDFNWDHSDVRAEFESILRFWLDRGTDGFRVDVADLLMKDPALPDLATWDDSDHPPDRDQPGVHEIYRSWRRILDSYPGDRAFVGEVWVKDRERFARYVRSDELHMAFNFDMLRAAWDAADMRSVIDGSLAAHGEIGAPASWVLSNHDVTRHVTRYGRSMTAYPDERHFGLPVDLELGRRRARAAAMLTCALPGSVYIYQGDELGLWEVEDIPDDLRQDPTLTRSGGTDLGRDGSRVPLPWTAGEPSLGFSSADTPWLPQPAEWASLAVAEQAADPGSHLSLYRDALRIRRAETALLGDELTWLPAPDGVLAFARGPGFACAVNFSSEPVALPSHRKVLLASGELVDGRLPADSAVWLRTG